MAAGLSFTNRNIVLPDSLCSSSGVISGLAKDNSTFVLFTGLTFLEEMSVESDVVCKLEIRFEQCTFKSNLKFIAGRYLDRVLFKNCLFNNLLFQGGEFLSGVYISHCTTEQSITISNHQGHSLFTKASFSLTENKTKYIHVSNVDLEGLMLRKNEAEWITVMCSLKERATNNQVYNFFKYFSFELAEKSKLWVNSIEIERLSFDGNLSNAELTFDAIKVKELIISEFTKSSSGILKLLRIEPFDAQSQITIRNSFLANTVLSDCNFKAFNKFSITTSFISEIVYANTTWPEIITIASAHRFRPDEFTVSKKEKNIQLKEIYRQLKIAASKQSDKFLEAFFYSKEMYYLNKTLDKQNSATKIVLIIGYITNNHKQAWWWPILWLGGLNTLFVLLTMNNYASLCMPNYNFNWQAFFTQLNPTHRFDELNILKTDLNYFLDFIWRVFNSFLIYQTISAFSKLSKE